MIKVDKEKCIGCGACTSVSDNFEMKDGKAVVKDKNSKDKSNKEAEDICPVKAIIIE
jgi:ferredoxin